MSGALLVGAQDLIPLFRNDLLFYYRIQRPYMYNKCPLVVDDRVKRTRRKSVLPPELIVCGPSKIHRTTNFALASPGRDHDDKVFFLLTALVDACLAMYDTPLEEIDDLDDLRYVFARALDICLTQLLLDGMLISRPSLGLHRSFAHQLQLEWGDIKKDRERWKSRYLDSEKSVRDLKKEVKRSVFTPAHLFPTFLSC